MQDQVEIVLCDSEGARVIEAMADSLTLEEQWVNKDAEREAA